jgi:uncharacterized protein YxjI
MVKGEDAEDGEDRWGFWRNRDRDSAGRSQYLMRENLFSIGDDYWIETGGGERAFKANGKALRVRDTLVLEGSRVRSCTRSRRRSCACATRWRSSATARPRPPSRRQWSARSGTRYSIEVDGGDDLEVKGNIVDHEFEFERGGNTVAEVSKRWFRVRDSYGIEIAPGQDDALILTAAICIDQMARG